MRRILYVFLILLSLLTQCFGLDETAKTDILKTQKLNSEYIEEPSGRKAVYLYKNTGIQKKAERIINEVIKLDHIQAEKALNVINKIAPNVIVVNKDIDYLILHGESSNVQEAVKVIRAIDSELSQILIEGKVLEISVNSLKNIGINWGKEQGSFKFSVDKDNGKTSISDDFLITVNALIAKGEANVLAHPKIITLDGKQAEINIGSRIPYAVPTDTSGTSTQWSIKYIDAGVSLKILSYIRSDKTIISNIKSEVSSVSEWRSTTAGEFPVISTRNADVTVKIRDGETLAIGGLISKSERENIYKVPILADIPFLGVFFQRKINEEAKTEVVFLITPHIID